LVYANGGAGDCANGGAVVYANGGAYGLGQWCFVFTPFLISAKGYLHVLKVGSIKFWK
jgi:hypothetical protein